MDQSDEMDEKPFKLSKEMLEKRAYERSRTWAQFMEQTSAAIDVGDICIEDMDDYLEVVEKDDCVDTKDMDEVVEVDVSEEECLDDTDGQDIMVIAKNLTISNANGLLEQINKKANESGIIGTEVQRVLEETLPVVEEYKRNWLQAGFERVLKTFDMKQIEEKVGNWIIRHNSFDFQCQPYHFKERILTYTVPKTQFVRELNHRETDSDSLHSDDTARYIRSSKKHLSMQKRVATTTTTIRSYRLVESRRNELRKKYEYLAPDDTMLRLKKTHLQEIPLSYHVWQDCASNCHKVDKLSIAPESHRIRRRRHRRHCSSPYTSYSSTDEEITPKGQKSLKPLCCTRGEYYSYRSPQSSRKKYLQYHDRSNKGVNEFLPYMRESECSCRGSNKLCSNARHLANSSTEDWLVENCESSKISLPNVAEAKPKHKSKLRAQNISKNKDSKKIGKIVQDKETFKKPASKIRTEKTNSKKTYAESKQPLEEQSYNDYSKSQRTTAKSKTSKKSKTNAKSKKPPEEETYNDSFEYELQKAIELSKQQYEEEQKNKLKSHSAASEVNVKYQRNGKRTDKPKDDMMICSDSQSSNNLTSEESHTATKLSSHLNSGLNLNDSSNNSKTLKSSLKLKPKKKLALTGPKDKEINQFNIQAKKGDSNEPTRRIQKKTNKKLRTLMVKEDSESENSDESKIVKEQTNEKSYQNSTNTTSILPENTTFFMNSGNICNSTAVANNTAIVRQIILKNATPSIREKTTKKTKSPEETRKVSKTKKTPVVENHEQDDNCKTKDSTMSTGIENHDKKQLPVNAIQEDHVVSTQSADCTIISSTTDSDLQQQTIVPNIAKKPDGRVVLYTPKNASLAPNDSIVNGRFRITEDHLASVIGPKTASKFMKYYVGPREFLQSSTIYYRPPNQENDSDSSDSDIDFIDLCVRYGGLDESKESKQLK